MPNKIWETRPENLREGELIAWALTEVARAIDEHYDEMTAATREAALEIRDGLTPISVSID